MDFMSVSFETGSPLYCLVIYKSMVAIKIHLAKNLLETIFRCIYVTLKTIY